MTRNPQGYYVIQIKHKRLRGGRFVISSRTKSESKAKRRGDSLRRLIEWDDHNLIEAIRRGELSIGEVEHAAEGDRYSAAMLALRSRFVVGDAPSNVDEAFDHTIASLRGTVTPNALKHYKAARRALAAEANTRIADFSSIRAQRFISEPKSTNGGKRWSPGTQHLMRTICKRVFEDAIHAEAEEAERQDRAPRYRINPFKRLKLPKVKKTRLRVLTHEEWFTLDELLLDTAERGLIASMALAGLRFGEVRNLRRWDIDLAANVIRIQEREGPHAWQPKRDRSTREVPISPELRAILTRHMELGYAGEEYFFVLPGKDRPISTSAARVRVRKAFTAAGIAYGMGKDEATPHTLRHTAATWWLLAGIPVPVVAKMLGDTAAVVMGTYAHVLPDSTQEAMKRASQALQRAAAERTEQSEPEEE